MDHLQSHDHNLIQWPVIGLAAIAVFGLAIFLLAKSKRQGTSIAILGEKKNISHDTVLFTFALKGNAKMNLKIG